MITVSIELKAAMVGDDIRWYYAVSMLTLEERGAVTRMCLTERLNPHCATLLVSAICLIAAAQAPRNLLYNSEADFSNAAWIPAGDAVVEPCGGNPCFALRNRGSFQQTITIPRDLAGHYVVVIASAASERVNSDGSITGLPYLYGLMIAQDGGRILAYLQGQQMRARPPAPNVWVKVWGIYQIPTGAHLLAVDLRQAERANSPQNGSAARFDSVGVYVFPTEAEANAFAAAWTGSRNAKSVRAVSEPGSVSQHLRDGGGHPTPRRARRLLYWIAVS